MTRYVARHEPAFRNIGPYRVRARSARDGRALWTEDDWLYSEPLGRALCVDHADPVDTGLLDIDGNALMRLPNPIGFGRDGEW